MRLGAHMPIAGGFQTAVRAALDMGCETLQIFTKNPQQWRSRGVSLQEGQAFQAECAKAGLYPVVAHDSYLINLASGNEGLRAKSVASFIQEVRNSYVLGACCLVTHMGSAGEDPPEAALERLCVSLDEVLEATEETALPIALETTAGQGNSLGSRFEMFPRIFERVKDASRLVVCLDTCHLFAAGYDIRTREGYEVVLREFDRVVGLNRLRVVHLNDSVRGLGSRVDRHAHIGQGFLGLEPFRCVLNDPRLQHLPGILETPKQDEKGRAMDRVNLETLRSLIRGAPCPT